MSSTESVDILKVNGICITDKEEMRKAIKELWENIGGVGEVTDIRGENVTLEWKDAEELNVRISREEVERYVKREKNCKAAGPDDIPYEMYKNGGEFMIEKMTELFNKVWEEERVPKRWNECRVTLLHKGGCKSKNELRNYRPIALLNTLGKIFSAVLNERLCRWIERFSVLGEEQNGFCKDRRAEDNMFVVNELIERKKKDGCGYGRDFGVKFSNEKSQVMIVNRTDDEREHTWRVGENNLKQTDEYKYLGVWLSPSGSEKTKNEKISMTNQWVGRLASAARLRASKYDVVREVWKSVAVPSIMYSMEVIAWKESEIDKLEVGQNGTECTKVCSDSSFER
ncbi:hypothetical protein Pmani_001329 [Petrolisthes manimaculis]|uniref:Reverse transcriptase domain-containing protein n=1 Tax=Petrolisthes manimaculis TaxID=1843537 RepID=A0AAE1QJM8_9EUCA|nr:hypothetical protein Pmani_001329 [Petrolisthes manimaculis]